MTRSSITGRSSGGAAITGLSCSISRRSSRLLLAVPVLIVVVAAPSPGDFLWFVGLTPGRVGTGLLFSAVGVPLAAVAGFIGSRDSAMQSQYPYSKEACADPRQFVRYEIAYLVLYYLPWEFVFRGLLFFPLVPLVGLIPALAVQTIVSTLYHFGHPATEIFAAVGAGIVFGLVAYVTGLDLLYGDHPRHGRRGDRRSLDFRRVLADGPGSETMKILVTGATGFVGSVLVPELVRRFGAGEISGLRPARRADSGQLGPGGRSPSSGAISPTPRPFPGP